MKQFKLKSKEVAILKKWGNTDSDIEQIEEGTNYARFETNKNNQVDWLTAKRMVGTMNFLSGLSRAAFHWTAYRTNDKIKTIGVYFDFSNYFRN